MVFPEEHEDEGARYAGKNHGADGNGAGDEDKPGGFRRGYRNEGDQKIGADGAEQEKKPAAAGPVFYILTEDQHRGEDKPEEKPPGGHGMLLEQKMHDPGETDDGNADAGKKNEQKAKVRIAKKGPHIAPQQIFCGPPADGIDGLQQLAVNAGNEGNGAPRNPRHDIGAAHTDTLAEKERRLPRAFRPGGLEKSCGKAAGFFGWGLHILWLSIGLDG